MYNTLLHPNEGDLNPISACEMYLFGVIFEHILPIKFMSTSCEIALR